jgi:hypothetical protein
MAYTATKTLNPALFAFPSGVDNTEHTVILRGTLVENDTATEYVPGGVGSTAFQVTAFSAVGLVTYSSFKGVPLVNGQLVVIYNTASNTNDGTFTVSNVVASSTSAGTFTAVPLTGKTLSGTGQTGQTAQGVGQLHFGVQALIPQTFTVTAVSNTGGQVTYTYTTLVGPQLQASQSVTIAGCTNAANNGTFTINSITQTSSTAGSFIVTNSAGVTTDSGTGSGNFQAGLQTFARNGVPVVQMTFFSIKGYTYVWNTTNSTVQIFLTGTSSGAVQNEAGLGATVAFDGTIRFEAIYVRG